MTARIAIVGRPNVGKSTLFNRLVGKRLALVDDQPGVTRDRREGEGSLYDLSFRVLDTAGLEDATDQSLEARMRRQTEEAMAEADLVLFLIDARAGVTPLDAHFAELLRRGSAPVVVVANKCEGRAAEAGLAEAWNLGLGEPVAVSAEHGLGLADLHERLRALLPEAVAAPVPCDPEEVAPETAEDLEEEAVDRGPIQLAIVGRPNVGKSTLVNRLIGSERMLTGPEAGITRDAIAIDWSYGDRALRLVDTAGLRRKARVSERVERISAADTKRAIDYAQVVVLVLDAQEGLERQDLWIARTVIDEGRALVIALNKWDAVDDRKLARRAVDDRLDRSLAQIKGLPVIPLSGLTGQGLDALMGAVFEVYETWNKRIATGPLNRWLEGAVAEHPPPMSKGRRLKLRYITQARSRPPTFALFCSQPEALPTAYLRYLENGLREDFGLWGVPIRFHVRTPKNPYA